MKAFVFVYKIFRKFPMLLLGNIVVCVSMGIFGALSLLTISPLVDFFINPGLKDVGTITQKAIDVLSFFHLSATFGNWVIIFIGFVALSSVFQIFARYTILKTKYAVLRDLMIGSFEDFFNAEWRFFSGGKQGVLINTFMRELTIVGDAFGAMAQFFAHLIQVAIFLVVPFYISPQTTLISVGAATIFAIPFFFLGKINYKLGTLNTSTANHMNTVIYENISLAKIILGFGNGDKSINKLKDAFSGHRRVTIKSQILKIATPLLYNPFAMIVIVVALFSARRFNVSMAETMVLLVALRQVASYVGGLTAQKNSLENFFPSYEQVLKLRERARRLKQVSGEIRFDKFEEGISVNNVTFSYFKDLPVLEAININIPKGKMVAFVGESGSGKSTLIDIIMGFHSPTSGEILIDGTSLTSLDITSFRHKVGYVPQSSVLFNATIRDNFLWALETASEEDIIQACKLANAEEFIKQMPDGYDTVVGDRGIRLSGGQVQRIALARAILRKPDILILDEATSALDTYSERLIQQAIEKISKKTTVLVVAHRLSTIVNADYVYVLDKGRVVEKGTYLDLVEKNGHFNHMITLQSLGAEK